MDLYLIRHGVATPRPPDGSDDAGRALTAKGRRRWKRSVRGLANMGLTLDRIVHSPWLRAVETADVLAAILDGETEVDAGLTRAPTAALLESLQLRTAKSSHVALVGHEPHLSELAAWLLFGAPDAAARFALKKGGVLWLRGELRAASMQLVACLPPRWLRAARE